MKTTAAVLVATDRPLELADLTLPAPGPGQLLVEIVLSGVCHTQLLEARGRRGPDPWLPHCLGHEGAGVVVECGPNVSRFRSGDRVILSWIKSSGRDAGGAAYDWNGRKVNAGPVATFGRHAIVSENRATPLPTEVSFAAAAILGCAGATGLGAVWRAGQVRPGDNVAVFGVGGVGLCAVQAAALTGAGQVLAIDRSTARLKAAERLGANRCIDASQGPVLDEIRDACPGGVDVAIEATGRPEVMALALDSVRAQGGAAVIVGNAPFGERLSIDPRQLNQGKRLLGTWGGDAQPDEDFPRYCRLLTAGKLNLGPLLENVYPLSAVNQALDDLENQRAVRPLIDMRQDE